MSYNYANKQYVRFIVPVADGKKLSGFGVIRGVAVAASPVIGASYIVEPSGFNGDIIIPNEDYPFSEFCVSEMFLSPVPRFKHGE